MRAACFICLLTCLLPVDGFGAERAAPPAAVAPTIDFQRDIQPIFSARCHACHGPEKQRNGLRLDRKADAWKGGDSGPAFVPGQGASSRLYRYVAGIDPEIVMPQKGERLTTNQVAMIKTWIDQGATWPEDAVAGPAPAPTNHWAFLPPRRPVVPVIRDAPFEIRNPIDAFLASGLKARGLNPSPAASRRVLLRRLCLDLTGLPPSPEQIAAFLADNSRDAWERQVDRVLASPHYGERWARHWLDLARWAETEGYEKNTFRASVWRYRDYVVQAFNRDKPYDRFLLEQIAGDEMVPYADDHLIATGFLSGARYSNNEEDKAVQRNDVLVDIANMTAGVTLGLTLSCAQCHDHKFDPLTIRDYYRWQGFFVRGQLVYLLLQETNLWKQYAAAMPPDHEAARNLRRLLWEPARTRLVEEARRKLSPETLAALDLPAAQRTDGQKQLAQRAARELEVSREAVEKALSEEDRKLVQELDKKIARNEVELREKKPQIYGFYSPASSPHPLDMLPPKGDYPLPYEPEQLKKTVPAVFKRGDVHQAGDRIEPGWPEILGGPRSTAIHSAERRNGDAVGRVPPPVSRSALVDWLVSPENPLTARVLVNFVWQQHFGRGLVETAGDFGVRGVRPTHPELLDWLATEFRYHGWSIKHVHRLILNSSAYRQASRPDAVNEHIDPENRYLWRWMPRRLEAEAVRDSVLFVSADLDPAPGGPSVPPEDEEKSRRRTLYLRQSRGHFPVAQAMFDGPTANESCPRRYVSTVPLQPLFLMNSRFMVKRAEAFAARVFAAARGDAARQIDTAFVMSLGRQPTVSERAAALVLLESPAEPAASAAGAGGGDRAAPGAPAALVRLCHSLFNVNEFVYLE